MAHILRAFHTLQHVSRLFRWVELQQNMRCEHKINKYCTILLYNSIQKYGMDGETYTESSKASNMELFAN